MRQLRSISTFESLKLRGYRLLWMGQASTTLGMWMDQIARGWLVYSLTNSPLQLGLVTAARGLPLLLFGVVAGVAADRYSRKGLVIVSQVVNAILHLILATLILTGGIQIWHIYVTALLAGTVQTLSQPARQVLIHDLVGEKHLPNAIALNAAVFNMGRSVGPAIGGVLIQAFGVAVSYYTQAALYALATVWTTQIKIPKSSLPVGYSKGSAHESFFKSAREGFSYIGSHRLILAIIVLGLGTMLLGAPYSTLMPIFAIDVLDGGATTQGLLLTMAGIGAVIGALTIASLGRRQGSGKLLIAGAASFGLSLVFFSQSPVLWMAIVFTFLIGLSNSSYSTQAQTLIQMRTPPEVRGRVVGLYALNNGLVPIGGLIAGVLASFLGGPWAVTIMGASCFLLAIGIAVFVPDLWKSKLPSSSKKAVS